MEQLLVLAALDPMPAAIAAIAVVVGVIILWKLLKFAFRIALIVAAAAVLFFIARQAGWL